MGMDAPQLLVNIDVDVLDPAIRFYTEAFGLHVARRLGPDAVELVGAAVPIYLLAKPSGTPWAKSAEGMRHYGRHWTPVHLDLAVEDLEAALHRAVQAGARREGAIQVHRWGRIALLTDPFGHGFCLLQFERRGYDEIATT
jgi:predicted enzyme related to lactoylglutathione lyase